jgi:hypothetical protein
MIRALIDLVRALFIRPAQLSVPMTERRPVGQHVYLSTACLHERHGYCAATTGQAGPKTPAQCKFCAAPCTCPCHRRPEGNAT